MHSNLFSVAMVAAAAAASLGASASTIPSKPRWDRRQETPAAPAFQAINYSWGCSPGGCSNSFNLSATAGYHPGAPSFNVTCNGIYIQQGWRACWNPDNSPLPSTSRVETIWTDGPERERQYLGAAHVYQQADGSWVNATGVVDILPVQGMSFGVPVVIISTRPEAV